MKRPSLRMRLTLWYGALFLVAGGLLLGLNHVLLSDRLSNQDLDPRAEAFERVGLNPDLFESRGRGFGRGGPRRAPGPPTAENAPEIDGVLVDDLILSVQQDLVDETLDRNLRQSGVVFGLMSIASIGLGWLMAGRMLRPIGRVTATARQLTEHNLHERVGLGGPEDELKEMADQFDVMLDRLETAFDAQKAFVANASHELRTPLTMIRTEIEVTLSDPNVSAADLERTRQVTTAAIGRAEQLIDALLILARADATFVAHDVELAEVAREALMQLEGPARDAGIEIRTEISSAVVAGEPSLLQRVVANLVQNAITYNVAGGWVTLVIESTEDSASITVENSGPVVEPAAVAGLFQRFARGERSRSRATGGAGLGLAIVASVVRAHRGSVTAEARDDGGLRIVVVFNDR